MKTEKKVLLGFLLLGISIALISFFIAKPENDQLVTISNHHYKALSKIQNIETKAMEAIEESFAYAVSGKKNEKEEFLKWNKLFPKELEEFTELGFHSDEEIEITRKLLLNQKDLVKWADIMFLEYENMGKISLGTFQNYELSIDGLSENLEKLVQFRHKEISDINIFINKEISSNKNRIHVLGALALSFCIIFGYFLYIHIQREEFKKFENERLLDSLSKNTTSVMYLKGIDGRYLFVNKRYEELFKLKNENIKGKTDLDIFPKEIADNLIENDRRVMSTGHLFEGEEVVPHEDGQHTYISIKVPLRDSEGVIYGICGVSTDITERKNAEKELEAFASIASHDLQAPLRKISLFGDRLKESAVNLDERSREYIERMQNSAQQMSFFIEEMLNFSIISDEKMVFDKINLEEQLKSICEELSHMILSTKGVVKFSDLPEIEGNKSQINQLFINLITNSLKYKREDEPPLVNIYSQKIGTGSCKLLVEDNGIGFEDRFVDRIFEPFQRLHSKSKYPGTGLGLAICKKIVSRHNGTISVASKLGQGSTFAIILPEKQTKNC